jgi:hypothetical protein
VTLCCQVRTPRAGTAWVAALPASMEDWGAFVRAGEYFDAAHWEGGRFAGAAGGDAVLARIGYRWPTRHEPVGAVTWSEARAFCASRGGRLPWLHEWRELGSAVARLDAGQIACLARWLPEGRRHQIDGAQSVLEWCGDWYNPAALGPGVRAEGPPRRRITGEPGCMVPASFDPRLGFRVAFESVPAPCSTGVADWELVEPPCIDAGRESESGRAQSGRASRGSQQERRTR